MSVCAVLQRLIYEDTLNIRISGDSYGQNEKDDSISHVCFAHIEELAIVWVVWHRAQCVYRNYRQYLYVAVKECPVILFDRSTSGSKDDIRGPGSGLLPQYSGPGSRVQGRRIQSPQVPVSVCQSIKGTVRGTALRPCHAACQTVDE